MGALHAPRLIWLGFRDMKESLCGWGDVYRDWSTVRAGGQTDWQPAAPVL